MVDDSLQIIPFCKALAVEFRNLNLAWISKYFAIEPTDEAVLSNPKEHIIDKGGHIFFAAFDGEIAGTFALMKEDDNVFELSKMAVSEKFQGRKIGNKLLKFAIEKAREIGARKLILFSNTMLAPAIHLYKKYGFAEVSMENSEYKRSNIKMERQLL